MYISESIGIETIFLKHITLLSNRFLKKEGYTHFNDFKNVLEPSACFPYLVLQPLKKPLGLKLRLYSRPLKF